MRQHTGGSLDYNADVAEAVRLIRVGESKTDLSALGNVVRNISLRGLSGRAFKQHPFGFAYLFISVSEYEDLRIHLWPVKWRMPEEQEPSRIHDHPYSFTSVVLLGEVENRMYQFEPSDDGLFQELLVSYSGGKSNLGYTRVRGNLKELSCCRVSEGRLYKIQAGEPHSTEVIRAPAVTVLLLEHSKIMHDPRVYLRHGRNKPRPFARSVIDDKYIREYRDILKLID